MKQATLLSSQEQAKYLTSEFLEFFLPTGSKCIWRQDGIEEPATTKKCNSRSSKNRYRLAYTRTAETSSERLDISMLRAMTRGGVLRWPCLATYLDLKSVRQGP